MHRLRLYLDTSVICHLFHDDTPERKASTEEFFNNTVVTGVYDCFISGIVLDELNRATDVMLRQKLLSVVQKYDLSILPGEEEELGRMARIYIEKGILPSKRPEDAFHVAYATVFELDILVTWNYRHLAKATTASQICAVNLLEGYLKPLRLLTPLEVLEP